MSDPKIGSKVRAVRGESALVGTLLDINEGSAMIQVDDINSTFSKFRVTRSLWTVERLLPEEPPPGTVVRVTVGESTELWVFLNRASGFHWKQISKRGDLSPGGCSWEVLNNSVGVGEVEIVATP